MTDHVHFTDFNFKLAVIQVLMYEKGLLTPKFDIHALAKRHPDSIDIERDGYGIIPEAQKFFEDLTIPREMLVHIDELIQDGGNHIHHQLIPFWDGEDETFNITSSHDAAHLPNLKKVRLLYDDGERMVKEFRERGIEADYV